ncbi:hypothetical protein L6P49_27875, partial [Klebsiella pneumoniae]|nr:hypothetical protein [Klebsiella pneumoniae]MCL3627593.1 hypothetical protein [Klebsiella pneumoniae]
GKKSAQIREILISESAWEEMTCLFAPSPDSHIFCISIEEFEYLMSSCKEHGRQPYEVLRYAVEMNRTPSQTVFLFIQHLEKFFGQVTKSEMIRKTGLDLLERMTENIPGLKQNVNLVNE